MCFTGIQPPQMITVYKYLIHENIGGIEERGSWCISKQFAEAEGVDAIARLDKTKKSGAPHRVEIWLKRIRIPSYQELQEQAVLFLLKFGGDSLLGRDCVVCLGQGQAGDEHSCHWPTTSEEKVALLARVVITVDGLNAYVTRVGRAMNATHDPTNPGFYDLDRLRDRCVDLVITGITPSPELDHLMNNLNEIEIMQRDEENQIAYD